MSTVVQTLLLALSLSPALALAGGPTTTQQMAGVLSACADVKLDLIATGVAIQALGLQLDDGAEREAVESFCETIGINERGRGDPLPKSAAQRIADDFVRCVRSGHSRPGSVTAREGYADAHKTILVSLHRQVAKDGSGTKIACHVAADASIDIGEALSLGRPDVYGANAFGSRSYWLSTPVTVLSMQPVPGTVLDDLRPGMPMAARAVLVMRPEPVS